MGKMASHLAHEIRNPIGSISLLSSALMSSASKEQQHIVLDIQKAIYRVERIIKATLLFGKEDAYIQIDPLKIEDLEMGIAECMSYYSFEKEIDLKITFPKDLVVKGNLELLLIVFQNMVFNAIDAIEEQEEMAHNTIEVNYSSNQLFHIFEFYDSGIPISNPDELFEPYKTTKIKGNGLGLVLSLKIAKSHGGDITLSKDKKGFFVFIKKEPYNI